MILPQEAIYDSFAFVHSKKIATGANAYSPVFSVESGLVPVHDNFKIRIKADRFIPQALRNKILIKRSWGDKTEVVKASGEGDWFTASFKTFGNFELISDDEPPIITGGFHDNANLSKSSSIYFVPKDNNEETKNFRAELDGNWLLFTNDKGRTFIYKFDEHCSRGIHELKISVEDEAGNTSEKIYHFTR